MPTPLALSIASGYSSGYSSGYFICYSDKDIKGRKG